MGLDYAKCTGCHACVSKCPQSCISMELDDLGFLYPIIDKDKCVNCGLCEKVCDEVKKLPDCSQTREIYAVKHKNLDVVKASSSGGVFSALSDCVIEDGGEIVGAVYAKDMGVMHSFAQTKEERDKMRGSKYTYSLCNEKIFAEVERRLQSGGGRKIMFVGTPCQVSALKSFLRIEYDNLILVDFLCHGICAPIIYDDFIKDVSKKNKEIVNVNFRHHEEDWRVCKTIVEYDDGSVDKTDRVNAYFKIFKSDYCLREACCLCPFASFDRCSDITMGDFWGIENFHKDFDSENGVSICLLNTIKGKELFAKAQEVLDVLRCEESDCKHKQLNGLTPKERNQEFVNDYLKYGYTFVRKKYATSKLSIRIKERLYKIKFINKVRNFLKKTR